MYLNKNLMSTTTRSIFPLRQSGIAYLWVFFDVVFDSCRLFRGGGASYWLFRGGGVSFTFVSCVQGRRRFATSIVLLILFSFMFCFYILVYSRGTYFMYFLVVFTVVMLCRGEVEELRSYGDPTWHVTGVMGLCQRMIMSGHTDIWMVCVRQKIAFSSLAHTKNTVRSSNRHVGRGGWWRRETLYHLAGRLMPSPSILLSVYNSCMYKGAWHKTQWWLGNYGTSKPKITIHTPRAGHQKTWNLQLPHYWYRHPLPPPRCNTIRY